MSLSGLLLLVLLAAAGWPVVWGTGVVWYARGWFARRAGLPRSSVALSFGIALLWTFVTGLAAVPSVCLITALFDTAGPGGASSSFFLVTWLGLMHLVATIGAAVMLPLGEDGDPGDRIALKWGVCWAAAGAWVAGSAAVGVPFVEWLAAGIAGC